jgi:hypothetical protein
MKNLLFVAMILALAGCGVSASGGAKAPAKNTGFFGSEKEALVVDGPKAFSGKKDVIIGAFRVGFITYNKVGQKTGGGMFGGARGSASAKSTLHGVSEETMQKITDAAYANFTSTLKANGYNVVDRGQLTNTAEYKKMATEQSPYKTDIGPADVTYLAPAGMPVKGTGFAFSTPGLVFGTVGGKTGVPVLDVDYMVNFVQGEGAGFSVATVEVGQGVSVTTGSGLSIYGDQGGTFSTGIGSIKLGQDVYSTEEFATVADTSTAAGQALGYAANVVTLALGAGSSVSKSYDFTADPAKYKTVAEKVLADANARIIGGMVANR